MKSGIKTGIIILCALSCAALAFISLKNSLRTYVPFSEAIAQKKAVQILGTLDKSAPIETQNGSYTLLLKDKDGTALRVRHRGLRPVNLEHADSIVARGTYSAETGFFEADKILVKCPSRYAKKSNSANESSKNK